MERVERLLENFNFIYSTYTDSEYSRKVLINMIEILHKVILVLEESFDLSQSIKALKEEMKGILDKYQQSGMVFKKKEKLIIADSNYNLTAVTKGLVYNYYQNIILELQRLENE